MKTFCLAALVGVAAARDVANNSPDNAASRAATTAYGGGQAPHVAKSESHSLKCYDLRNVAACRAICEATQDADACTIVAQEAMSACPQGMARKVPGQACQSCTSDADFKKYFGCGYTCDVITCAPAAQAHTCPSQRAYESLVAAHKAKDWMKSFMNGNTAIAATACNGQSFTSTRATFPFTAGNRQGLTGETVCTAGHACKTVDAGACQCAPTTKQ